MERMGAWLQELVPEARIVMAHGQMDSKPLEAVMLKFFHKEADILLASAIIQSGLDVPNANTIIVNRADAFGLAQLYQLRGRVGRSGEQAYAYFLVPDEGTLSEDAQKRLTAIQQFTELGSGFRIAPPTWKFGVQGTCSENSSRDTSPRWDWTSISRWSNRPSNGCAARWWRKNRIRRYGSTCPPSSPKTM